MAAIERAEYEIRRLPGVYACHFTPEAVLVAVDPLVDAAAVATAASAVLTVLGVTARVDVVQGVPNARPHALIGLRRPVVVASAAGVAAVALGTVAAFAGTFPGVGVIGGSAPHHPHPTAAAAPAGASLPAGASVPPTSVFRRPAGPFKPPPSAPAPGAAATSPSSPTASATSSGPTSPPATNWPALVFVVGAHLAPPGPATHPTPPVTPPPAGKPPAAPPSATTPATTPPTAPPATTPTGPIVVPPVAAPAVHVATAPPVTTTTAAPSSDRHDDPDQPGDDGAEHGNGQGNQGGKAAPGHT